MCMRPCGPIRYTAPRYEQYVEIKTIKEYSLSEARSKYTDEEVLVTSKKILEEKTSWSWNEKEDRYVLEKLYYIDPLMARIAVTDKNRQKIKEMVV